LIFFVYPDPKGSEEPSQTLIFSGSSITPAPGGAKNRIQICWRARRSQNQLTLRQPADWGKSIDFQAILNFLFLIPDSHFF
jgi:hypothetical protein